MVVPDDGLYLLDLILGYNFYLKHRYEFKNNHGEWVTTVKPDLGPGISERVWEAIQTTGENIDACYSVKAEIIAALTALLEVLSLAATPQPKILHQKNFNLGYKLCLWHLINILYLDIVFLLLRSRKISLSGLKQLRRLKHFTYAMNNIVFICGLIYLWWEKLYYILVIPNKMVYME